MASDQGAFDKDFGYLIPFLDRVAAAVAQLPDAAARDEAARLIAGEKEKWTRLRQLLAGAPGSRNAPQQPAAASASAAASGPAPASASALPVLTFGSLKTRR
ncbi:MAG: hypothetical protein ACK4N5_06610 [Myxococcales bacterium]